MLQKLFLSLFLGLKHSRDTAKSFDNFDHFINKELVTENKEVYHGYVSKYDANVEYKQCIIILHGISDNRRDFITNSHFVKNMREEFLYVVPEFPGFGESKLTFTKAGCYKSFMLWMKYVKEYYNIHDFVIIGQSFGATLGLDFYNFMYKNEKLEDKTKQHFNFHSAFKPEHEQSLDIQFNDYEKFKISNLIVYSPFTVTHDEVMDYYSVQWASFILRPMLNYFITSDINFDLTVETKGLDSSIITITYTLSDDEVPADNSIKLKSVYKKATFVEYEDHGHINLFRDKEIWIDNYNQIKHGKRQLNYEDEEDLDFFRLAIS